MGESSVPEGFGHSSVRPLSSVVFWPIAFGRKSAQGNEKYDQKSNVRLVRIVPHVFILDVARFGFGGSIGH